MNNSLVCQACDTLTMMRYCPKCDAPTVPYEPRGSGTLCVGPPKPRASSTSLSQRNSISYQRDSRHNPRALSIMSSKAPYEELAKRLSPSMERNVSVEQIASDMKEEDAQEQLSKERDIMVQSASDILRITDGFQTAQKKSIRVIDLLYEENQELRQQLGIKEDVQDWRKVMGFSPPLSSHSGPAALGDVPPEELKEERRFLTDTHVYENLIDEISRRSCEMDRHLEELISELEKAEELAQQEKERLSRC